jgi:pyruvate, orthophosphate dikinase
MARSGVSVILLRRETFAEDVHGMYRSAGTVSQVGHIDSHAAVSARGWGRPCIVGVSGLDVDEAARSATLNGVTICEGDVLSVNGSTGEIISGAAELAAPQIKGGVSRFLSWADEYRKVEVFATAASAKDTVLVPSL